MRSAEDRVFAKVRDKDHAVLECIRRGDTDVHAVKQATTLTRREVNYCFEKLADLDLIAVTRPDGWTERVVDGRNRKFRTPKQATLTSRGDRYFDWTERDGTLGRYDAVDYEDLVETVNELEHEVEGLRAAFKRFRQQVVQELRDGDDTE